jgi:hypothetical protein
VPDLLDVLPFLVASSVVELVPVPFDPDVVVPVEEPLPLALDPDVVPVVEPLPLVVPDWPDDVLLLLLSEQPQAPRPIVPVKIAAVSKYRSFRILPPLVLTPTVALRSGWCNADATC